MKCYLELLVLAVAISSFTDAKKVAKRHRRALEVADNLDLESNLVRTKRKFAAQELLRVKRLREPEPALLRTKRVKRTPRVTRGKALMRVKRDPLDVGLLRVKRDPAEKSLSRVKRLPTDDEALKRMKRVRRNIVKKNGQQINLSKLHKSEKLKSLSRPRDGNRELRKRMKNALQKHRSKIHRQQRNHFRMNQRNSFGSKHAHKRPYKKNVHQTPHSGIKAHRNMKMHHVQRHAL